MRLDDEPRPSARAPWPVSRLDLVCLDAGPGHYVLAEPGGLKARSATHCSECGVMADDVTSMLCSYCPPTWALPEVPR
jgi:hypothetical protein